MWAFVCHLLIVHAVSIEGGTGLHWQTVYCCSQFTLQQAEQLAHAPPRRSLLPVYACRSQPWLPSMAWEVFMYGADKLCYLPII